MENTPPELIGSAEVCKALDIDRSTLTRWVASGRLTPAHKLPGLRGAFLFHRSTIDEHLEPTSASSS